MFCHVENITEQKGNKVEERIQNSMLWNEEGYKKKQEGGGEEGGG